MLASAAVLGIPNAGRAQVQALPSAGSVDGWIAEAAQRFAIPPGWIRRVMGVESAFRPRAVSRAGAMGLMQIMPGTYAELRARYGLGADPFHPHDNILAGAAYLRELYDRYGASGFLAAYNAGPGRYEQHLIEGRPLPLETRAYVATVSGGAAMGPPSASSLAAAPVVRPSLFVALGAGHSDTPAPASSAPGGLFVALTPPSETP